MLVSLIYVKVVTAMLMPSLIQVAVGTSARRPKLVGFVYVTVRRSKDVSNRFVLLTYQL